MACQEWQQLRQQTLRLKVVIDGSTKCLVGGVATSDQNGLKKLHYCSGINNARTVVMLGEREGAIKWHRSCVCMHTLEFQRADWSTVCHNQLVASICISSMNLVIFWKQGGRI